MAGEIANGVRIVGHARDTDMAAMFDALVATHEAPIARYLYGMVGDVELARDLTQETFLSAFRALPESEIISLSAWLYRIATNHAFMHLRHKRLLTWIPLSRLRANHQPSVSDQTDRYTIREPVEAVLLQLDAKDRACLLLKAAGFSAEEIGAQLGCSPTAARTRLSRARQAFRQRYHADNSTEDR